MMECRAHPITILTNLGKVLYLIIIPVLRGFFYALRGNLALWVQSAWIDICIFVLMIAMALLRWIAIRLRCNDRELILEKGFFLHRTIRIPWKNITTLSVEKAFYLRPFRAVTLRVDTIGGSAGQPDFSLFIWHRQAKQLLRYTHIPKTPSPHRYTPSTGSIIALSLLTSNSLGGVLFMATLISQAGKLIGQEFANRLLGTVETLTRLLAFGLPPAAAAVAYTLLTGWLIAFVMTFLRYKNFTISRDSDRLHIQGGLFSQREYDIRYKEINFIDIRQSIATKWLHLYSLYISAVGYAKRKDDIRCVIPAENYSAFSVHRGQLFPAFSPVPRQLRPSRKGFIRFLGLPLGLLAGLALLTLWLVHFFPRWHSFFLFVGLMSLIPAALFFTIRLIDFLSCGIAKAENFYTIYYSKRFYLHTVVIPEEKIVMTELRQGFFQRFTANCDLLIYTRAERRTVHRCRNLNKTALIKWFRQ